MDHLWGGWRAAELPSTLSVPQGTLREASWAEARPKKLFLDGWTVSHWLVELSKEVLNGFVDGFWWFLDGFRWFWMDFWWGFSTSTFQIPWPHWFDFVPCQGSNGMDATRSGATFGRSNNDHFLSRVCRSYWARSTGMARSLHKFNRSCFAFNQSCCFQPLKCSAGFWRIHVLQFPSSQPIFHGKIQQIRRWTQRSSRNLQGDHLISSVPGAQCLAQATLGVLVDRSVVGSMRSVVQSHTLTAQCSHIRHGQTYEGLSSHYHGTGNGYMIV